MFNKIATKQHDITDCGAACLSSICSYYGHPYPLAEIRQYANTNQYGTSLLGMINAAERIGFNAKGVRIDQEVLKSIPLPAIAHIKYDNGLYHYVVVYKMSNNYIKVMDPIEGEMLKWSYDKFYSCWTKIMIILSPQNNNNDVRHNSSIYKRLIDLIKPHKYMMLLALVGSIVCSILSLVTSIFVGKVTDYVIIGGNTKLLSLMGGIVVSVLFVKSVISIIRNIITARTSMIINTTLILEYYKHILGLPQKFYDTMRVGEIISRINDATKISSFLNETSINIIVNMLTVIFAFSFMFIYSYRLAAIVFLILPVYIMIYYFYNKLNKKYQRKTMEDNAKLETQLVESLNNIHTIKRYSIEEHTYKLTKEKYIKLASDYIICYKNSIYVNSGVELFSNLLTVAVFWYGSLMVLDKTITIGSLMFFFTLMGFINTPILSIIASNHSIQDALISMDRLFQIMDLEVEKEDVTVNELKKDEVGDIVFHNVSFNYGQRQLFSDLNLTIKRGEITAIVGESGSGKSTIGALIQKIYMVKSGKITIGNQNINDISNFSIRKRVVIIPQKVQLFDGSIMYNISLDDQKPNKLKIKEILKSLDLDSFIKKLPDGLDTRVGEKGMRLSGGECQKIAIARALYRDPDVLVLDEATSSLDSISENTVKNVLQKKLELGMTIIIIAHRLSTVKNAHNIIVLYNGEIAEQGNHEFLIKKNNKYFQLWSNQHI